MSDSNPIETVNTLLASSIRDVQMMGIHVIELTDTRAVTVVPIEGNQNHLGSMYAGALFAGAEILGGAIFYPTFDGEFYYPTVKELTISYKKPAMTDIRAEGSIDEATLAQIHSELETTGKTDFVFEAELTDTAGQVVATSRGIYSFRRRRDV